MLNYVIAVMAIIIIATVSIFCFKRLETKHSDDSEFVATMGTMMFVFAAMLSGLVIMLVF